MQVEHYRPKGGYRAEEGQPLSQPGYYWLAADWMNLLPSCTRCNSGETHDHADRPRVVSGKANWFPLANEKKRATKPGDENAETPLLLHPYRDDPHDHLKFAGEGVVRARNGDLRGQTTIDVIGLNRQDLVDARNDLLVTVEQHLTNIKNYAGYAKTYPNDKSFKANEEREIEQLLSLAAPGKEYSSTVRARLPRRLLKRLSADGARDD
jgi:hypothetical protein